MLMTGEKPEKYMLTVWANPKVKRKIDGLAQTVAKSRSAVLRALIMRATLEDLPASWRGVSEAERELLREVEA
jgi:predicted transcriptional regulator